MIDVKELSIGNWVNYRPGWKDEETGQIVYESGTGFPVKIEMIYFCHGEGLVQYNDGQNNGIEACDYELFPIEITPEILEKNGWKLKKYSSATLEIENKIVVLEFYESGTQLRIFNRAEDEDLQILDVSVTGIHQLQNALTLCGINKNIEL